MLSMVSGKDEGMGIDPERYRGTAASTIRSVDLDVEEIMVDGERFTEADAERESRLMQARYASRPAL